MGLLEFLKFVFPCFEERLEETLFLVEDVQLDLLCDVIKKAIVYMEEEVG